jgi:hypothetical protein
VERRKCSWSRSRHPHSSRLRLGEELEDPSRTHWQAGSLGWPSRSSQLAPSSLSKCRPVLDSLSSSEVIGGRPESAFQGLKATSSPGSCMLYSHRRVSPISRFAANRDPDSRSRPNRESGIPCFPIPAKSGIGDSFPDSRPNRESGERELGISGSVNRGSDRTGTGTVPRPRFQ